MTMHTTFLLCIFSVMSIMQSKDVQTEWEKSTNLNTWYTPFDLCLLSNDTSVVIEDIMAVCEQKHMSVSPSTPLRPNRCRAGNSWPSKGGFCSPVDIPYSQRDNLRMSVRGFDDPMQDPLRKFFSSLSKENGALLLIGDSVMQQYYSAMACELERVGIWSDPSRFKDTDALKYVSIEKNSHAVPIRFTPIYHFVNGKYDRVVSKRF